MNFRADDPKSPSFATYLCCGCENTKILSVRWVLINVLRGEINRTAQELLDIPGIAEVYSVTGDYDLVAVLRLKAYEDLAGVVTEG